MTIRQTRVFAALADPTRRAIFERLFRSGEHTVWMLTERGDISQQAVSKHLAVLKSSGLVRQRREGRETHYSAQPDGLRPLADWMGIYVEHWRDAFETLLFTGKRRGGR